jgi:hypothetical protein
MTGATTWHGRRGTVILGPTEHRVARWLAGMTRTGRVTLRTVDLAAATGVERSEAYRITARLRVLGLFGIENDRGGNHHGRRYWRTATEQDAGALDVGRHREAWARIVAWARARRDRAAARLAAIRGDHTRRDRSPARRPAAPTPAAGAPCPAAGVTFAEAMRTAGLGRLMERWGV